MLLQLQLQRPHLAQRVASRRTRRIPRAAFARAQQRTQVGQGSGRAARAGWSTPAGAPLGGGSARCPRWPRGLPAARHSAGRGGCPLPAMAEGAARCPHCGQPPRPAPHWAERLASRAGSSAERGAFPVPLPLAGANLKRSVFEALGLYGIAMPSSFSLLLTLPPPANRCVLGKII